MTIFFLSKPFIYDYFYFSKKKIAKKKNWLKKIPLGFLLPFPTIEP